MLNIMAPFKTAAKYYYNNYIVLGSVYNDRPIAVVHFDSGGAFDCEFISSGAFGL